MLMLFLKRHNVRSCPFSANFELGRKWSPGKEAAEKFSGSSRMTSADSPLNPSLLSLTDI